MADVLPFPGLVLPAEACPNIVALIEELLAEARAGKITTFGAVSVEPGGSVGTSFATSGAPHAHHLVAGVTYLLRRAQKNAGVED